MNLSELVPENWKPFLESEFKEPYFIELQSKLDAEYKSGAVVYPPVDSIFRALQLVAPKEVKVAIIGQDCYHDTAQATGLCFSVPRGQKLPSSLRNIYKEIRANYEDYKVPVHGNLDHWAEQGVLMLNATLTVRAHQPNSHSKFGWQKFTDAVIRVVNEQCQGVVFICWGAFARKKVSAIDNSRHYILESAHPSGLSAHKGFFGNRHFIECNEILNLKKQKINW